MPDRQPVPDRAARQLGLQLGVREAGQHLGVAGGELAVPDPALDLRGQGEQPERVGDRGALLADPLGDLLLGQAQIVDQRLEGGRLLDGVQLLALEVLDEGQLQQPVVRDLLHDRRDLEQPRDLGRPPAALPRDQLVLPPLDRPDDHRLEHPVLLHRRRQLLQALLLEPLPRLLPVGHDPVQVQLGQPRLRGRRRLGRLRRRLGYQTSQPLAQCLSLHRA